MSAYLRLWEHFSWYKPCLLHHRGSHFWGILICHDVLSDVMATPSLVSSHLCSIGRIWRVVTSRGPSRSLFPPYLHVRSDVLLWVFIKLQGTTYDKRCQRRIFKRSDQLKKRSISLAVYSLCSFFGLPATGEGKKEFSFFHFLCLPKKERLTADTTAFSFPILTLFKDW